MLKSKMWSSWCPGLVGEMEFSCDVSGWGMVQSIQSSHLVVLPKTLKVVKIAWKKLTMAQMNHSSPTTPHSIKANQILLTTLKGPRFRLRKAASMESFKLFTANVLAVVNLMLRSPAASAVMRTWGVRVLSTESSSIWSCLCKVGARAAVNECSL